MVLWIRCLIIAVVGYALGNFATGVIVSKLLFHSDIRASGSGNTGATNMLRTRGWVPSVITLAGDILKAVIATLIGKGISGEIGMMVAGVAVIAGHNWPVVLGFRGGKGIAASLGFIIVTSPLTALILAVIEFGLIAATRVVSVGSIAASICYPIVTALLFPGNTARIVTAIIMAAMALFSHRANIARIFSGSENKLDFRKIHEISKRKGRGK